MAVKADARASETRGLICPSCSHTVLWTAIQFASPFSCPSCGERIRIASSYLRTQFFITLVSLGTLAYLFGARWLIWLLIVVLGYFPLDVVTAALMRIYAPPKLHLSDDYLSHLKDSDH
jgi:DNA-directed RNA polymerase subunit RPC12/RpoP